MAPSGHDRCVKCTPPVTVGSKLCAGWCHWCQFMGTHARRSVQGDIAKVERLDQYSAGVVYKLFFPARDDGCHGTPAQRVSLLAKQSLRRRCRYRNPRLDCSGVGTRSRHLTILPNGCNSFISMFVLSLSGRRDRTSRLVGTATFENIFFPVGGGPKASVGTLLLVSSIVRLE